MGNIVKTLPNAAQFDVINEKLAEICENTGENIVAYEPKTRDGIEGAFPESEQLEKTIEYLGQLSKNIANQNDLSSKSIQAAEAANTAAQRANTAAANVKDGTNGTDGISATHSWNGTTLTITSASGTSSADLKGDTGETGATGANGQDGYTPVKGVDYFTEADKEELIAAVIESLGGSPIFGYVDENNNIVVSGSLSDGTYSVKYEMADGSTVDIGNLVLDSTVYYSITNSLANCTINNSATEIAEGESYSAAITANDGYELSSVVVTMSGADISSSAVSGSNISIASVSGNIVITAVAEEIKAAEPVTVDIALTDGIRIGSDGTDRTQAGYCATEHIDLTNVPKPCTIHLTKARWAYTSTSDTGMVMYYATKADGTKLVGGYTNTSIGAGYFNVAINDTVGTDVTVTVNSDDVATLRFSGHWANSSYSDNSSSFSDANTKATLTYTPAS